MVLKSPKPYSIRNESGKNNGHKNLRYYQPLLVGLRWCFLLYISGLNDTGYREIYETYMHFGQISYNGKICNADIIEVDSISYDLASIKN